MTQKNTNSSREISYKDWPTPGLRGHKHLVDLLEFQLDEQRVRAALDRVVAERNRVYESEPDSEEAYKLRRYMTVVELLCLERVQRFCKTLDEVARRLGELG